jgi:uncharacterized protein
MYRKSLESLKIWFHKKDRQPLILRGARQVGKSTLVRNFAKENDLDLIEFNFENFKFKNLSDENFNLEFLIQEIEDIKIKKISKNTLFFFDEIQESPVLLKKIRYFYEEQQQIAVICAGSLLEFALNQENFSFPVGRVEFHHLGPMTFDEFLIALDQTSLSTNIQSGTYKEHLHEKIIEFLHLYYYIGGMPKSVQTYLDTKSLIDVRTIQQNLNQSYKLDFPKYGKKINVERLSNVFQKVSANVGQKVIYQKIDSESKTREIRKALEMLIKAKLLMPCFHSEASPSGTLENQYDDTIFKIYFLDIGLLNAMLETTWSDISKNYEDLFIIKGFMAEQFIAQHLQYIKEPHIEPKLFYWLRDKSTARAEVDFVIQNNSIKYPIEVKADKSGGLKSLSYFCSEKKVSVAIKMSLAPYSTVLKETKILKKGKTKPVQYELVNVPIYFVESFEKFLR